MSVVAVEVTVPPEWAAGIAALAALTAIDLAAVRLGRATISRLARHHIRRHPVAAVTAAAALGLHLVVEFDRDPLCWAAGWAARQTGER